MRRYLPMAAVLAVTAIGATFGATFASGQQVAETVVDAKGMMRVPADYRLSYPYLGTWSVAADEGQGAKEMHIVYGSPGAVANFQKNGKFVDGDVLVKEVYDAATADMTTGTVSHDDKLKGWFVMVKDDKNKFPDNKLWGKGWGWSWFDVADPVHTTTTDYSTECLSCHIPAKNTDWIYSGGYPILKK
jgi:hypothetical protein